MGSTRYMARRPKFGNAIPSMIMDVKLFDRFPMTQVEVWHETGSIRKFIFLCLHPCVERPNRTIDAF
jgi:hypothetical protein